MYYFSGKYFIVLNFGIRMFKILWFSMDIYFTSWNFLFNILFQMVAKCVNFGKTHSRL